MMFPEFQIQMARMIGTFGKTTYSDDRISLIYQEVRDYELPWFKKIINEFIGDSRQAPLLKEFREAASIERGRMWDEERKRNEKDAKDFMKSRFSDEETSMLIQGIIKRITGQSTEQEYAGLQAMLNSVAKHDAKAAKCMKCDDTCIEVYFDGKFENQRLCRCA